MTRTITCPSCGEAENLSGAPSDEGIRIRCGACDTSWLRDAAAETCATCGGTDLEVRPRALTQYSRGTQLSIVGMTEIMLCRECDAEMLEWSKSGRAVPPTYRPAALDPDAAEERARSGNDERRLTP